MQKNPDLSRSRLLRVVRFGAPLSVQVHALCVLTSVTSSGGWDDEIED